MKVRHLVGLAWSVLALSSAQAQRQSAAKVPANLRPPAGMCRILLDGVAPAQQPAPTKCESAIKNRPPNGTVIFGNDFPPADAKKTDADPKRGDLGLKGVVAPPKSADVRAPDPKPAEKKAEDRKADPKKPDTKLPPRRPPGR